MEVCKSHHAACWLANIHITILLPSSFYGEDGMESVCTLYLANHQESIVTKWRRLKNRVNSSYSLNISLQDPNSIKIQNT